MSARSAIGGNETPTESMEVSNHLFQASMRMI